VATFSPDPVLFVILLILAVLFLPLPWNLVVIVLAAILEVSLWFFGVRYSRRRRATVGVQTMVGMHGIAISTLEPGYSGTTGGQVKVDGEIWEARAHDEVRPGDTVRVTAVDGLTLEVEKE
jgi:membrane-bound serine protease (ClpP class)